MRLNSKQLQSGERETPFEPSIGIELWREKERERESLKKKEKKMKKTSQIKFKIS